MIKFLLQNIH